MAVVLFGKELSTGMAVLIYSGLALVFLGLVALGIYYWRFSQRVDRFLARDLAHNNMQREELVESFLERGEKEWPCSICFHENHPSKRECVMCGTQQVVSAASQKHLQETRASGLQLADLEQHQQQQQYNQPLGNNVLDQQSRVRSFHVRRLKEEAHQLTARQKAAVRRHIWKRRRNPMDGKLQWYRIDDEESELAYRESVSRLSEQMSPDDVAMLQNPELLQQRQQQRYHPTTLFNIEEDCARESLMIDYTQDEDMSDGKFQPLRATALRTLDELNDQQQQADDDDYFGGHNSEYWSSYYELHYHADPEGKEENGVKQEEAMDERQKRLMNMTSISTGYVRHENDEGIIDWTPAIGVALDMNPGTKKKKRSTNASNPPILERCESSSVVDDEDEIECTDDLEEICALTFKEKTKWFMKQVNSRWKNTKSKDSAKHIRFVVRRDHLIEDSVEQVLKCPKHRFWERIRLFFENEPGLDAGGLIREWYELLANQLFQEDRMHLFIPTKGDNLGYWINPDCKNEYNGNNKYLQYYEFIGRLIAKALIEGQNLKVSLALPLIKHILEVPISFSDLEFLDEELYRNARWLKKNDGAEQLALTFSVTMKLADGQTKEVELMPNGADIDVTDENKKEYLELLFKYYMFDSISEELTFLLKGFYDIVPKYLVSVFDYQEFDLLLSGVPNIDVKDWQKYTENRWLKLEKPTPQEMTVIQWFWEVVTDFSKEQRARLLQFATGTSRVPIMGFQALTSNDGRVRRFAIQMIPVGPPPTGMMPKSHTCFNRIDLPLYKSKEELNKFLTLVINMEITGFWLE